MQLRADQSALRSQPACTLALGTSDTDLEHSRADQRTLSRRAESVP